MMCREAYKTSENYPLKATKALLRATREGIYLTLYMRILFPQAGRLNAALHCKHGGGPSESEIDVPKTTVAYSSHPPTWVTSPPFPSIRHGPISIMSPSKDEQPGPPCTCIQSDDRHACAQFATHIQPEDYPLFVCCSSGLDHEEV